MVHKGLNLRLTTNQNCKKLVAMSSLSSSSSSSSSFENLFLATLKVTLGPPVVLTDGTERAALTAVFLTLGTEVRGWPWV